MFYHPASQLSLSGKALVVPIVSTANVSQLAADLLIASLQLNCVGIFDARYSVPAIGARDEDDGLTSALELYGLDNVNVVVMQPRSPILKSQKEQFIAALLDFATKSNFSAILLLSGIDTSNRVDGQMATPTYFIKPQNSPSWDNSALHTIQNLTIPAYISSVTQYPNAPAGESTVPFIPGGGLTRLILAALPARFATPVGALLQFVAEGDNRTDALLMASVVGKILGLDGIIQEWKQPRSWEQGLFGTPQDQTLYG